METALSKQDFSKAGVKAHTSLVSLPENACQHSQVREIGQDFDKDGMLLRLMRCQQCGLLIREYLAML
jgi:hypothetical protein